MKKFIIIAAAALLMQYAQAQTTINRSHAPAPGPAPVLDIKSPVIYKLNNGITLLVVEDHRLPKVSASYYIDAGPVTEGSKAGVMSLMGGMLNEGTKTMTKEVFDQNVDLMGANVELTSSGGYASSLTRYFKKTFSLLGQALREPAFTEASFDKLKSQELTGLKSEAKSARAIAYRVTNALSYGKNHPDGEFETEQSINGLTLQDVKDFYAKYITPSRGYLTITGDITPAAAKALATEVLGSWKGAKLQLENLPIVPNPPKTEVDLVNLPTAVQSEINVVNLVDLKMSSPDYFPALLANYILGGGPESHLFMDLREKHAFTYGAYSSIGAGRFQSLFDASASVRNPKTDSAVMEFVKEIKGMSTDTVSSDELKIAKALYSGAFARGLEDPSRTASFARNILINHLPADFYKTYLQKINAVTAADVQRVGQKYMNYNQLRIIIVGNEPQIIDGLKAANLPIYDFDKFADPVKPAVQ